MSSVVPSVCVYLLFRMADHRETLLKAFHSSGYTGPAGKKQNNKSKEKLY